MLHRSRVPLLVVVVVAVLAGSPGSPGSPGPRPAAAVADPTPFPAAAAAVPPGFHQAQCSDLRARRNSGLALRVVVPPGYHASYRDNRSCGFTSDIDRDFSVSFGATSSLKAFKEKELDPYDGVGGDEEVNDIVYVASGPVLGTHTGERLDYRSYNDGLPLDVRLVQADGVSLSWHTPDGKMESTQPAYDAVAASVGLVSSDVSTCEGGERGTATFVPPIPQTESIDFYRGRCHIYLQPGRSSLLRYAEVVPAPRAGLARQAARLRATRQVVSVRVQPGGGRLGGRAADKLTWVVRRTHPTENYEPAGTWRLVTLATPRLQATWAATPEQWRTEADDARRFFRSVRPGTTP